MNSDEEQRYEKILNQHSIHMMPYVGNILFPLNTCASPSEQFFRMYTIMFIIKKMKLECAELLLKNKTVTREQLDEYSELIENHILKNMQLNIQPVNPQQSNVTFW